MVIVADFFTEADLTHTPFLDILMAHAQVYTANQWVIIHKPSLTVPANLPKNVNVVMPLANGLAAFISMQSFVKKIIKKYNAQAWIQFKSVKKAPLRKFLHITPIEKGKKRRPVVSVFFSGAIKQQAINEKMPIVASNILLPAIKTVTCDKTIEDIKQSYTNGREYFYCLGINKNHNELLTLLKAFSAFKRLQKSNWKLVIDLDISALKAKTRQAIETFKYRDDVIFLSQNREELVQAAYAVLILNEPYGAAMNTALVLAAQGAIIGQSHSLVNELAQDAALYFEEETIETIAQCFMQLYKDEQERSALRQMTYNRAQELTVKKSIEVLDAILHKSVRCL